MVEEYRSSIEDIDASELAFEEAETILDSFSESQQESLFLEEMETQEIALDALRAEEGIVRSEVQSEVDTATMDAYSEAETIPDLVNREMDTPVEMTEGEILDEIMDLDESRKDFARDLFMDDDDSDLSPELLESKRELLDAAEELKNDPSLAHIDKLQNMSVHEIAEAYMDDDNMDSELISSEVRKVSRLMPSEMWRIVKAQVQYGDTADALGRFDKRLDEFLVGSVQEIKHGVEDARYDLEAVVAAAGLAGVYKYERAMDPLKKDWVKIKEVTPMMVKDVKDLGRTGAKTTAKIGMVGSIFAAVGGVAFFKSLSKSMGKEMDNFRSFAKNWIEPVPLIGGFFKSSRERSEKKKKSVSKKRKTSLKKK